jgi:hypothetical protein
MYWYNTKFKTAMVLIGGLLWSAFLPACKPEIKTNGGFDLTGYIKKEAASFKKSDSPVIKTVYHDHLTVIDTVIIQKGQPYKTKTVHHDATKETKTVHVNNWDDELSLFTDADINKPAFKNSYKAVDEDGLLVYKARDKDLKVQELIIKRVGQNIKYILIYTRVENLLYKTTQKLTYFPDSVYRIETVQHVRLLGTNTYFIEGKFK